MLIIHAHPRPSQSRVIQALLGFLQDRPGAQLRSLYQLYPDFDIDVEAEQQALRHAQHIVWLTPVYWYSVPALSSTGSTKCSPMVGPMGTAAQPSKAKPAGGSPVPAVHKAPTHPRACTIGLLLTMCRRLSKRLVIAACIGLHPLSCTKVTPQRPLFGAMSPDLCSSSVKFSNV
jgi:Flavodoxin-like fold